jgi:hypothetical protein
MIHGCGFYSIESEEEGFFLPLREVRSSVLEVSLWVLQTREEGYIAVLCGYIDLHIPNWSWYVEFHGRGV